MNIKSIKTRANELLLNNKEAFLRILLIMMFVEMIPDVLGEIDGFIGMILSLIVVIAFIPYGHGYIVSSLKVVRNKALALNDQDAFVGFKRYSELAGTYFVVALIEFVIALVIGLISISIILITNSAVLAISDPFEIIAALAVPILLFVVVLVSAAMVMNAYFFSVPFLLEQYGYKGMQAVRESFSLIKGHVGDFIKLELSYLGWVILLALISGGLSAMFSSLGALGSLLANVASSVIGLLTFIPKYRLAIAVFFEEIAYKKYHVTMQSEPTYIQGE